MIRIGITSEQVSAYMYVCMDVWMYPVDLENFVIKKVTWNKSLTSFNFVKHWLIQNLFNNRIFPIYGIILCI